MSNGLPLWEQIFFADMTLEDSEQRVKEAERAHDAAAQNYINSVGGGSYKVRSARKALLRAADRLHWNKLHRDAANSASCALRKVTTAQ